MLNFFEFFTLFKYLLGNKKIVVDEFHRLPKIFLDYLHSTGQKGELTLVSSTLWLSRILLSEKSPLLGLFYEVPFTLIDERDMMESLVTADRKELVEAAVYLREPILLPLYAPPIREFLTSYLTTNKMTVLGLVGEIFHEEKRGLSRIYEGIMRAVASGKMTSTEISSFSFPEILYRRTTQV